jgi:hypothetical protein
MTAQQGRSNDSTNVIRFTDALPNGEFGQPMLRSADRLFATFVRSQRELLDFVAMRMEKEGEVIRELAACRTWAGALAVQSQWVQETIRDCAAEATKRLARYISAEQQEAPTERADET